ncbi:MAG TPA: metallophosphatase, partial [Mycobacterium sp.]|nr:metallophosphatase [Mycobacterium sp.]
DVEYAVGAVGHAAKRNATVVVHLGDFGYNFTDAYLDALDRALADAGMVLGFVDGNHENFDWLLAQPIAADGLRYLRDRLVHLPRGFRWRWGAHRCVAVGGAYSIDQFLRTPHRSWWPQETITSEQAREIAAAGPAEVMFCHDCPAGIEVPGAAFDRYKCPREQLVRSDVHRALLRSIVDTVRPARLWHGHFHHRYQALLGGRGYRTVIDGLGRNGDPIDNNMVVLNVSALGSHRLVSGPMTATACSA